MLKLSVSSMGTYDKCPKKYHYRYIEKPDVEKAKWSFTEFGSCAHMALELFHKTLMKKDIPDSKYSGLMKWAFKKSVESFELESLTQPTWTPDGEKMGLVFLKEILQDYLNLIREDGLPNVIGVEVPYSYKVDGVLVRGFIDRLDRIADGEYRVVDYKTSKSVKYLDDFQLLVYAEAIKRKYEDAKIVHGSYMLLKHKCTTKDWTFSLHDHSNVLKKIKKSASLISLDDRWVKKPSVLCNWCDYRKICQESWAE